MHHLWNESGSEKSKKCSVPCGSDIKAIRRDCETPEQRKAFGIISSKGGEELIVAVREWKSKCSGHGRGARKPRCNWIRYQVLLEYKSEVQTGTRSVWLKKAGYAWHKQTMEGLTKEAADQAWYNAIENAAAGRVSACKTKLLCPLEEYVIEQDVRSHNEQLVFGTKVYFQCSF